MVGEDRGKRRASRDERENEGAKQRRTTSPEELVVLFKVKGDKPGEAGFRAINPLQIDESLRSQIGRGFVAKILNNGVLKVTCPNKKQYEVAMSVGKVVTKVEKLSTTRRESGGSKGVIYGLYAGLAEKEILENIEGGEVTDVKRFRSKEGARGDPPVLLTFKESQLPDRVCLGSMVYRVREYIRPPLRCYNCQRYGHIADACHGKRKCAKCGGDHGIKECDADSSKCANCGGNHGAADKDCEHTIQARKVQVVKERDSVTYAEAVKIATRESGEERRQGKVVQGNQSTVPSKYPSDMLVMSKESFLSFVVEVLAAAKSIFSKENSNSSDTVREVVGAANRFLGEGQVPEKLYQYIAEVKKRQRQRENTDGEEDTEIDGEGS